MFQNHYFHGLESKNYWDYWQKNFPYNYYKHLNVRKLQKVSYRPSQEYDIMMMSWWHRHGEMVISDWWYHDDINLKSHHDVIMMSYLWYHNDDIIMTSQWWCHHDITMMMLSQHRVDTGLFLFFSSSIGPFFLMLDCT